MTFELRRLQLRLTTADGPYGCDLQFQRGLNVLAAPNTSGKSTCVQAILFALGLEGMLGPGREVPLPHVMTQSVESPSGTEIPVVESQVLLEIADAEQRPLTFRRYPAHPDVDKNLVTVWPATIDELQSDTATRSDDYYVRRPGAAQREAGFHRFLAARFGWELPAVPRFSGGRAPLYLEVLAPLWFVEQKRGWSGLQAQTPTYLGLREAKRRALEFTLGLDAQERIQRIEALLAEREELATQWSTIMASVSERAEDSDAAIEALPSRPTSEWPMAVPPRVQVAVADGWASLEAQLREDREALGQSDATSVPASVDSTSAEHRQLAEMEEQLAQLGNRSRLETRDLEIERATAADAEARLTALTEDIRRHQDVETLRSMGSDVVAVLQQDDCPTCHQPLQDVLLPPEDVPEVLATEASVTILQQQLSLIQDLKREADRVVAAREARLGALRSTASDLRQSIRAHKDSLTNPSQLPSVAEIERRLVLRAKVERLLALREAFLIALDELGQLSSRWRDVTLELDELRSDELSADDRAKLERLEGAFKDNLALFGFRSCPVDQVILSLDNYMPTHEGFELSLDFSASDGIRLIWAYLIALLQVGNEFNTNHPGIVVFDEPKQQAAAELSLQSLLRQSGVVANSEKQILFATSEPQDSLTEMLRNVDVHLEAFDSKIIGPL